MPTAETKTARPLQTHMPRRATKGLLCHQNFENVLLHGIDLVMARQAMGGSPHSLSRATRPSSSRSSPHELVSQSCPRGQGRPFSTRGPRGQYRCCICGMHSLPWGVVRRSHICISTDGKVRLEVIDTVQGCDDVWYSSGRSRSVSIR